MTTHNLKGEMATRRIWLDGKEIFPNKSQKIFDHSVEFCWGYGGSGPAQLALAILVELGLHDKIHHQNFKWCVVAKLPQDDFQAEFTVFPLSTVTILSHDMQV